MVEQVKRGGCDFHQNDRALVILLEPERDTYARSCWEIGENMPLFFVIYLNPVILVKTAVQ